MHSLNKPIMSNLYLPGTMLSAMNAKMKKIQWKYDFQKLLYPQHLAWTMTCTYNRHAINMCWMIEHMNSELTDEARQVNKKTWYGVISTILAKYLGKGRRKLTFIGHLLCYGYFVHFPLHHTGGETVTQFGGTREGVQRKGCVHWFSNDKEGVCVCVLEGGKCFT